jgi:small subunit ribosomal protein S6
MNFYETVFIARQDATPGQVETLAQNYTQIIKDHGGEVTKTEFCGLRNLAYRIKKNRKGHYVLMNIACSSEGVKEIERQMRLNEDVLRYLTVKVEALDNNPSPLMQQRHYREDRHRSQDSFDLSTESEDA